MKKRIVSLAAIVALIAIMLTSFTMAYFTDETDVDTNVMTMGSVDIEQVEQERCKDEGGAFTEDLQEFTPNKPVVPAVGTPKWDDTKIEINGGSYKVFDDEVFKNTIDKIITVDNNGKSDAYIRTIVMLEAPGFDPNDLIGFNYNLTDCTMSAPVTVTVGGVDYVAFAFTYNEALEAGASSAPSLVQVYLGAEATNEDVAPFGDTWEIKALSQAVQADGFDDPAAALNEVFGEVNAANLADWFAELT